MADDTKDAATEAKRIAKLRDEVRAYDEKRAKDADKHAEESFKATAAFFESKAFADFAKAITDARVESAQHHGLASQLGNVETLLALMPQELERARAKARVDYLAEPAPTE